MCCAIDQGSTKMSFPVNNRMPANPLSSLKRAMRINSSTYLAGLGLRGMAGNIRSFAFVISAAPCTLFAETANLRVTRIAVMRLGYDAAPAARTRV
jgi:hypothetical protein